MKFQKSKILPVIGLLLLVLLILFEVFRKTGKDFDIFLDASRFLLQGKSCYDKSNPAGMGYQFYYYSPLFALMIAPLTFISKSFVYLIFVLINYFFLYRIYRCIFYFLDLKSFSEKQINTFFLLVVITTLRFIIYNLDIGQMTIFLVYASMESVRLISSSKKWQGAILLALAMNIKILPLFVLGYVIYQREFRAGLYTIAFFILLLFLPGLFIGFEFNQYQLHEWYLMLSDASQNSLAQDNGRQSLTSLVPSIFMDTIGDFPYRRNIFSFSEDTTIIITTIVRGLFCLFTFYFLLLDSSVTNARKKYFCCFAYVMLITPLVFPHQGKYSYFYLLPAYVFCIYQWYFTDKEQRKNYRTGFIFLIISFLLGTMTTDLIIGMQPSKITLYYSTITWGAIALAISMVFFTKKIKGSNTQLSAT